MGVSVRSERRGRSAARGDEVRVEASVDTFCREVIAAGAGVRLPTLLAAPPRGSLYHQPERHGVAVIAVPTSCLRDDHVDALLRFRLAQYLDVGFVDRPVAYAHRLRTEPATVLAPGDIHLIAGVPATGEVLCYAVLEQAPQASGGCRLRAVDRPLFPVERVHGAGLYNRLPILPDLAVCKVRELGRFVKNQRPAARPDLVTRAVVELGAGVFRLVAGPLRMHVDAVIGDLEERVAKQNLDFFHIPSVVIRGTVPYQPSASYLYPRYQRHAVHPFACLTSDISSALPRLQAIDRALAKPGRLGLLALLRLKTRSDGPAVSMLHPGDGAGPLAELRLPQLDTGMRARSRLLERGALLRRFELFAPLSVAEATMLGTLMQRVEVAAGQVVVEQDDPGDALYFVESGRARLEIRDTAGRSVPAGELGPGDCWGHLAVLANAAQCATVSASTDMTLLRLSKQCHDTYLGGLPDIDRRLSRHALRQWADLDRQRRDHPPDPPAAGCACGPGCSCTGRDSADHATRAAGTEPGGRHEPKELTS